MKVLISVSARLPGLQKLKSLLPKMVKAAQLEYDLWDESNTDEYAGGGICHMIAEKIADVLNTARIYAGTVSSSLKQSRTTCVRCCTSCLGCV